MNWTFYEVFSYSAEANYFKRLLKIQILICRYVYLVMGQKIKKKPKAKKNSWNQIDQFHEKKIFFDQIPFFAISKMAENQFLN